MAKYPKFNPAVWTTPEDFSKRLNHVLWEHGITQSDLAAMIWGRNKQGAARKRDLISCYIMGRTLPSWDNLVLMAEVFDMSPAQLMPRTVPPPGSRVRWEPEVKYLPRNQVRFTVTVPNFMLPKLMAAVS